MSTKKPPSVMGDDERATEGARALKERQSRPMAAVVPTNEFGENPTTGVMEAAGASRDDILRMRAGRDTKQRLANVEAQTYDIVKGMGALEAGLGEVSGEVAAVNGRLDGQDAVLENIQSTQQATLHELQEIKTREHTRIVSIMEVDKQQQLAVIGDVADQRKVARAEKTDKRQTLRKVMTALIVAAIGGAGAALHWLAGFVHR